MTAADKDKKKLRSIVMLANGHKPFDTRIFVKEASSLVEAGYSVTIIVPHTANDEKNGVKILAVRGSSGGFSKLFINPWRILSKAFTQSRHSIFCIHDSDILITGLILKILGRKVIYDAHEDTPLQIAYQHWIPGWLKKFYALFYLWLEKSCGLFFDAIIVAEPVIAKYFPAKKTFLVRNFPIARQFQKMNGDYQQRKDVLLYVGTLSKVRGLFQMLDSAKKAAEQVTFEFTLGGQFAPASLENDVLKQYTVNFLQWVSYENLVDLLYQSKIGIIIPNPITRYKTNYPVKLFEFMAAGLPVIASSEGESASFVREARCGILVDPLNIDEIADAIVWLFKNSAEASEMGKRGRSLIMNKYNWETESETLLQVYGRLSN